MLFRACWSKEGSPRCGRRPATLTGDWETEESGFPAAQHDNRPPMHATYCHCSVKVWRKTKIKSVSKPDKSGRLNLEKYILSKMFQRCRLTLRTLCRVERVTHKEPNTVWFHLQEVSEVVKLFETKSRMAVTREGDGKREPCLMCVEFQTVKTREFWRSALYQCEHSQHCWAVHLKIKMANSTTSKRNGYLHNYFQN